jgi:hypothetical protein
MTLIVFIIYTMTAVSFGAVIWGLLKIGSDADETIASAYWCQVAFMSRSIMTEEQKKKLDEMMEEK